MTDTILLTIPANERFRDVATMVPEESDPLDLSYERMDDLQLAVSSALVAASGEVVTMEVEASEARVSVGVGPLVSGADRIADSCSFSSASSTRWRRRSATAGSGSCSRW